MVSLCFFPLERLLAGKLKRVRSIFQKLPYSEPIPTSLTVFLIEICLSHLHRRSHRHVPHLDLQTIAISLLLVI